jgi:hypothetical protein
MGTKINILLSCHIQTPSHLISIQSTILTHNMRCMCLQMVSTMANLDITTVATSGHPNLWFQVYVIKDRGLVESWIRQAEAAGYKAIMVTVDAQRLGKREADQRNRYGLKHVHTPRQASGDLASLVLCIVLVSEGMEIAVLCKPKGNMLEGWCNRIDMPDIHRTFCVTLLHSTTKAVLLRAFLRPAVLVRWSNQMGWISLDQSGTSNLGWVLCHDTISCRLSPVGEPPSAGNCEFAITAKDQHNHLCINTPKCSFTYVACLYAI